MIHYFCTADPAWAATIQSKVSETTVNLKNSTINFKNLDKLFLRYIHFFKRCVRNRLGSLSFKFQVTDDILTAFRKRNFGTNTGTSELN